jgi:hypothetical protein
VLLAPEEAPSEALTEMGAGGGEASEGRREPSDIERKVSAALTREVGVLAGVLDSSLMYCRAQTKQAKLRPDEVLISGGGSMLPGFAEALSRRMRMRVAQLEPFRQVSLGGLASREVEDISAEAPRYAVALGLAASRLRPDSIVMSMVPEDVKARRRFLESGLWMWYAAACMFLVSGLLVWAPLRNRYILDSEHRKLEELRTRAEKENTEFSDALKLTRQRAAEVKTLEERVHSGRDIYQVLGLLRQCAVGAFREKILLLEINNRPTSKANPQEGERTQNFQKARSVFVRGQVDVEVIGDTRAAEAAASRQARDLLWSYIKELKKRGGQRRIVQEVVDRYVDEADKKVLEEQRIARREFILEIVLDEPGKSGPSRLAAGGRK